MDRFALVYDLCRMNTDWGFIRPETSIGKNDILSIMIKIKPSFCL